MTYHPEQPTWRRAYERIAPLLVVICLLTVFVVSIATFALNQSQERDRRDREQERDVLLGCFDDFASDLTASLPPVREATEVRDAATAERDNAFQDLTILLAQSAGRTELPDDQERLEAEFADAVIRLAAAGQNLDRAQAALVLAREENPYPDPPSQFCEVG